MRRIHFSVTLTDECDNQVSADKTKVYDDNVSDSEIQMDLAEFEREHIESHWTEAD